MRDEGMFRRWEGRHRRGDGPQHPRRGHRDEDLFEGRPHERRERVERGAMRYVLLDALRDGPKHGYEIIRWLEERTNGAYVPSPGAVYPTLQLLGDLGLVRTGQDDDRRVCELTDAGRAALDEHAEIIRHFWARFTETADMRAMRPEVGFVRDELDELTRTAWSGVRLALRRGDQAMVRDIRAVVEQCKNDVREIIARGASAAPTEDHANPGQANRQ